MYMEFSDDCQKALIEAKKEMVSLKHSYVGSEHLVLAVLKDLNSDISLALLKYGITYSKFKSRLIELVGEGEKENNWFLYTPLLKRVMENAILEAKDRNYKKITLDTLFLSLLEEGEGIAIRTLSSLGLSIDRFYSEYSAHVRNMYRRKKNTFLEEFGVDLVEKAKKKELDPTIGREDEIEQIIETLLRRKKNNPLLIGHAGVGKTAIVEELARRIAEGTVPSPLKNRRIFSISMASLVSGTKYRGEFEERINKLIKEVESNPSYILFIDEIHTLVGAGGAEGAIDASNIFKPVLSRGNFCLIGATTEKEYDEYLAKDKALNRRFQIISVKETSLEKTISILKRIVPIYEDFYNIEIPTSLLETLVSLSNQYINQNKQPDKAIELLDSACSHASLSKSKRERKISVLDDSLKKYILLKKDYILKNDFVKAREYLEKENEVREKKSILNLSKNHSKSKRLSINDIIFVLEKKTGIYIYPYHRKNKFLLSSLSKYIIGQDRVLKEISLETERRLYSTFSSHRPLSFLFVGPSGVGKTYTAEIYHKVLYSSLPFIRLDMSEYRESHSISKIIGSPAGYIGYGDSNYVLNIIEKNPHTVLLLDEIEKAHPNVLNLFLQVLDNGIMKNSRGEEIDFSNVTIIMTSNLGFSKNSVGFYQNKNNFIMDKLKEFLSIEFLNRIGKICVFDNLDKETASKIVSLLWNRERKKYKEYNVRLTSKTKNRIIEDAKIDVFGVRQIVSLVEKEFNKYVFNR